MVRFVFLITVFLNLGIIQLTAEYMELAPYDRRDPRYAIDMAQFSKDNASKLAEDFVGKLLKNGFVLLINAVDRHKLDLMKNDLEGIFRYFEANPKAFDSVESRNLSHSHVSEFAFQSIYHGRSLFDVLDEGPRYLCQAFFKGEASPSLQAHTRQVSVDARKFHQQPIHYHVDSLYHGPQRFVLNFWTPLDDCGVDKPTIQVCKADIAKVRSVLKFDEKKIKFDPEIAKSIDDKTFDSYKSFERFYFLIEKGDILVFSNWTLHAGYADSSMILPRYSMELRFIGPQFNPPYKL